VTTKLNELEGV